MPRVTGWNDGLCQDYDRRLGKWFADRLGARYQLRKEFDMIEQAKQQAARLREAPERSRTTLEAADTIDALVAEVERQNSRCGILKSLRDGQIEHVAAAFAERDKALAEVESLRQENKDLSSAAIIPDHMTLMHQIDVDELIKEVESLRKDAERYRFWRDRYPITFAPTDMTPEDVDRATDAAMQGAKSYQPIHGLRVDPVTGNVGIGTPPQGVKE